MILKFLRSYTSALRYSASTEDTFIIKLDRSLANLKLRCYDKALKDAVEFPPGDKPSEKGLYRAARCLYELGRFQESLDAVTSLLAHYPNNGEAKKETLRVERRLREQEHGDYDFHAMYGAAKNTPPCLDHATYVGPVTIKASNGRGRGLFTTRDVVAGELLLCEKAFSYCYADTGEGKASSKTSILMNTHTDRMVMGTQPDLITATVQKMYRNPSLMPTFISLYHGDYKPVKETEMDGAPIVDTYVVSTETNKCQVILTSHLASSSTESSPSTSSDALEPPAKTTSPLTNSKKAKRPTTPAASSSPLPLSTIAASTMPAAASLATCNLCAPHVTSQLARKSSSGMLFLKQTALGRRCRKSCRIGASNARASCAKRTRRHPRRCSKRGPPSWKTSRQHSSLPLAPTYQKQNAY